MQLSSDKIPFDVSLYRATKFARSRPADLRIAREELKRAVSATLGEGYEVDNPVTRARGQVNLELHATPEQRVLIEQVRSLQNRLDAVEGSITAKSHESIGAARRRTKPRQAERIEGAMIEFDDDVTPQAIGKITSLIAEEGYFFTVNPGNVFVPAVTPQDDDPFWKKIVQIEGVKAIGSGWE